MTATLTAKQRTEQWFSLAKYKALAAFTPLAWAKQINKRVAILEALNQGNASNFNELMVALIKYPLNPSSSTDDPAGKSPYQNTSQAVADLSYSFGSVIPLAFDDLYRLLQLRGSFPQHADSAIDEWSRQNDSLSELRCFGHIKVDLNAPDREIEKEFSHWLQAYRISAGVPAREAYRKEHAKDLKNWSDSKLLPYFDLVAWKKWSANDLTEDDIVELLYPGAELTRDKLRSLDGKIPTVFSHAC